MKYDHSTAAKNVYKYMRKAYKKYAIIIRYDTEQAIIDHLEKQESKNNYIKELIKKDMEAKKWQYQIMR